MCIKEHKKTHFGATSNFLPLMVNSFMITADDKLERRISRHIGPEIKGKKQREEQKEEDRNRSSSSLVSIVDYNSECTTRQNTWQQNETVHCILK